ncbi:MAG TPA: ATP-binding protein [Solirubrobacterales bacterium]|nr:ATP-binding protein [Solirubrobacterales bacterium]
MRQTDLIRLETALESSLVDGEFGELAAAVGLSSEQLLEEAGEEAEAILELAAASRQAEIEARDAQQALRLLPKTNERPPAYMVRLVLGLAVGLAVVISALALIAVTIPAVRSWLYGISPALGTILILWPAAILTFVVRWRSPQARVAGEKRRAAEADCRNQVRQLGEGWLRERINAAKDRSYETALSYRGDCSGLAEVDDPQHEISTKARERLTRLMERMQGGAIGISGPRGVGKSTLMRSVCGSDEVGRPVFAVVADAPVEYDGREFVLHLFAKVCAEVLGRDAVARLRGSDRPLLGPFGMTRGRILQPRFFAGPITILAGIWVFDGGFEASLGFVGVLLMALGAGLLTTSLLNETSWIRQRLRLRGSTRASENSAHAATAATMLRRIWFQQSFSSGWSGSLKLPAGGEAGLEASSELVEQRMSFPDVVNEFRGFLQQVSVGPGARQVRICIDELDKMSDEDARRFLNEIKVVFRVSGCFFLISISEDAMSFFERRGLPIRDVFDSSFDSVLQIPQLEFEDSRRLLDRRIVELPQPFACLLHCISGGLPRDLIRAARDLVELPKGTSLEEASQKLIGDELICKAGATKVAARRLKSEDHTSLLIAWLQGVEEAGCDANALLGICRSFEPDFLGTLAALPEEDDLRQERREVQSLGTQMAACAYLAATMAEFFPLFHDRPYVDDALRGDARRDGLCPVDRLADVTQGFSTDVNTAWQSLNRLRRDLEFEQLDFPQLHALPHFRDSSVLGPVL